MDNDDIFEFFENESEVELLDIIKLFYYQNQPTQFNQYLDPIYDLADCLGFAMLQLASIFPDEEQRVRFLSLIWSETNKNMLLLINELQENDDATEEREIQEDNQL